MKSDPAATKTMRQGGIIILIATLLTQIIPPSQAAQENIEIYKKLKTFEQINGIAIQRDQQLHKQGRAYNEHRDKMFHRIENDFKAMQDMGDQFEHAKVLIPLIQEQDKFLHSNRYPDIIEDVVFHQLVNKFNQSK